jgi:hypothetical protein
MEIAVDQYWVHRYRNETDVEQIWSDMEPPWENSKNGPEKLVTGAPLRLFYFIRLDAA